MENHAHVRKLPAWKSPWVIGWVALVLMVLSVNLIMVYLAMKTDPGLVVNDYYERGQDHEKTMFSKRANDPGWLMKLDLPKELVAGQDIPLVFSIVDKAGVPVEPESVTFYAYRPSDASRDFSLPMRQEAKGLFSVKPRFRLKGVWDIMISAAQDGQEYHIGQRLDLVAPE